MLEKLTKKTSIIVGSTLGYLFILIFPILYKIGFSEIPLKSYSITINLFYSAIFALLFFSVLSIESLFNLSLDSKFLEKKSSQYVIISGFIFSLICFLYGIFCIIAYTKINFILSTIILYWIVGIFTLIASGVGFIKKLQFNKIFVRTFLILAVIFLVLLLIITKH